MVHGVKFLLGVNFPLSHFNELNLRRLICTSYSGSKIDQIKDNVQLSLNLFDNLGEPINLKNGYVFVIDEMPV
jgi:hypothetical protein